MTSSWVALFPISVILLGLVFLLVLYFSIPSRKGFSLKKKHAVVTGGSKGIGKEIAHSLISKGCNMACEDLQMAADQRSQQQKFESVVRLAETELGPVDVLINNVGTSVQGAFDELPISSFEEQTRINYLSAVYATRCVVGGMKLRRSGHISFVSSAAGQCAIWGYTAYAPTKFAIRGFADALQMELSPYNINVSVLYPPNTDTEGFKVEMATMPEEVRLISGTAGFFSPQDVAKAHVQDIEDGQYATAIGLDGWMLCETLHYLHLILCRCVCMRQRKKEDRHFFLFCTSDMCLCLDE
uniref:3-dehydrosphinganine reductase n=1 Tax=Angiostrongylus cantonensis TaxID=6313 RepID=A0A0K0CTM2_ANGCA